MIKCSVTLKFGSGVAGLRFTGLFSSTCAAVVDAIERYPQACRVSAKAMP